MTAQYFSGFSTVAEIKAEYRRLAMLHHPDRGGDTATMQNINVQYHAALFSCNGQTSTGTDNREHKYTYNRETEQAVMDKIAEIVALCMVNVEIMLIGSWIWITGNTKAYKNRLGKNGLKCRWHSKRLAWYWHVSSKRRHRYNAKVDLNGLAQSYGCQGFDSEERAQIEA